MNQELDDLVNLVKSPGWQRWCQSAVADAQAKVETEMVYALEHEDDRIAAGRMRQAIAGKRAIERAIRLVHERIKDLQSADAESGETASMPMQRGGL